MALASREWCAHAAGWWVRRNPTYLLSAASMAVGAKLYLHAPDARMGDVGLMLGTLGVLQAYELAVAAVLALLQRFKRSSVDRRSLLLVAAIFWTAPLAATVELMQDHHKLGLSLGRDGRDRLVRNALPCASRRPAPSVQPRGWRRGSASGF